MSDARRPTWPLSVGYGLVLVGVVAWVLVLFRTPPQHRLEDDLVTCGLALDKSSPSGFQGYEEQACARAGVDLREIELDRRAHPRQLTTRERQALDRQWRQRQWVSLWEWWRGPQAYSRERFCATPGLSCLGD